MYQSRSSANSFGDRKCPSQWCSDAPMFHESLRRFVADKMKSDQGVNFPAGKECALTAHWVITTLTDLPDVNDVLMRQRTGGSCRVACHCIPHGAGRIPLRNGWLLDDALNTGLLTNWVRHPSMRGFAALVCCNAERPRRSTSNNGSPKTSKLARRESWVSRTRVSSRAPTVSVQLKCRLSSCAIAVRRAGDRCHSLLGTLGLSTSCRLPEAYFVSVPESAIH